MDPSTPILTPSPAAVFSVPLIMAWQTTYLFILFLACLPTRVSSKAPRTFLVLFPAVFLWHLDSRAHKGGWLLRNHCEGDGVKGWPFRTPLPSGLNVQTPPRPLLASFLEWILPTPLQLASALMVVAAFLIIWSGHNSWRYFCHPWLDTASLSHLDYTKNSLFWPQGLCICCSCHRTALPPSSCHWVLNLNATSLYYPDTLTQLAPLPITHFPSLLLASTLPYSPHLEYPWVYQCILSGGKWGDGANITLTNTGQWRELAPDWYMWCEESPREKASGWYQEVGNRG